MKNIPKEFLNKIETLKSLILTKSGLLGEYRKRVELDVDDIIYFETPNRVTELVLKLTIKGLDCDMCDFEPENISREIMNLVSMISNASDVGIDSDFKFAMNYSSLRGVLVGGCNLWRDTFESVEFLIFYDLGTEY